MKQQNPKTGGVQKKPTPFADESILVTGTLPETSGFDRVGHVIIGGVPLPPGRLGVGGAFLLETGGKRHQVDGTPAAWWPDGSVKWLRLCGAVDLSAASANPFVLLREQANGVLPAIEIRELPGIIEIATPHIVVRLRPDTNRALHVSDSAGRPLTRGAGISALLVPARPEGSTREAVGWTFEHPGMKIVERTPARVVVRLAGRFVEEGRTLAELVTFVEVVRDEPRIGIQPVLIYLGDPDLDAFARLDLSVHSVFGADAPFFGFGQDTGPGYWDDCRWIPDGHDWPRARLLQSGSSFYRLDKRTGPAASWVKIREGRRAQGWCHLGDATGGVTGAMRYVWQEYPRSLEVDADSGTLTFGLIPAGSEGLDLRRYAPSLLGATIYESGEGAFPAQTHGATGISKSSELMVRFHPAGAPREEAEDAGRSWTEPVRVIPDPGEFAASGVVGKLASETPAAAAVSERHFIELVEYLIAERDFRGWHGLMDYGDVQMSFITARDQWAFDDGGYAWLNSEALPDLGLWLTALRYGRADWMEASIAMTRHNRDVDMYHRGMLKGVGSRHNVNHWGCKDKEWRVSMPLVKRLHYYITGDPWTREVILETTAVFQSYERTSRTAPSMVSGLCCLMVKAELTGAAADHAVVERALNVFAETVRPDGHIAANVHMNLATGEGHALAGPADPSDETGGTLIGSYFFLFGFGGQQILSELAETYNNDKMLDAIVRHANLYFKYQGETRWLPHQLPRIGQAPYFLAVAYRRTGDERFKNAVEQVIVNGWKGPDLLEIGGDGAGDVRRHLIMTGVERRNKITCSIGEHLHLIPYGYTVFSD